MFGFRFGPPKFSLGVDIGSSALKYVMLKKGKTGPEVVAAGIESYPEGVFVDGIMQDPNAISQMIKNIKKEQNLKFEQVFTSIASQNTILRFLPLPEMEDEELKHAIEGEAEQYVPYPLETVNLNFARLAKVEQDGTTRLLCLLAVAQKEQVESIVGIFRSVGVKQLDALDIDSLAIINSLEKFMKRKSGPDDVVAEEGDEPMGTMSGVGSSPDIGDDEVVAIVCIGARSTIINVLKGHVLRFSRNVQISGNNITEVIRSVYKFTFSEAETTKIEKSVASVQGEVDQEFLDVVHTTIEEIAGEIRRSFDYFKAQHREPLIHRVILTGGTAKIKDIDKLLSSELSVEVVLGDPSVGILRALPNEDSFIENLQQYSVAIGLALRGVEAND
ncbi:MAG: type IV pilus assembly protein PilM [Candidatus Cloacimonetes bacterium]|nr:type IV pilus assembly protein PilM [Candidatus Cloacimonadota bacterium]